MSENKHTAEPWAVKGATIRTADGIGIDVIATMQVSNQPFWDEDARRIVACVNACAGCATKVLETAPVGFFNSTYGHPKYLEEITKQRDELLAALDITLAQHDALLRDFGLCSADTIEQARAVLASVKGEQ